MQNAASWLMPGQTVRGVIRFSLVKNIDLANELGVSRSYISRALKLDAVPIEIVKLIARKLSITSPEEFKEYYESIPESLRYQYWSDCRILHSVKPGISISPEEHSRREADGTLTEYLRERGYFDEVKLY